MSGADQSLWHALADPTRRSILDLLREKPRTTGDLASEFPTSRFAVMKHLGVLGAAGLVVSRKEGRERWHHLNAIPLQEVHERWVTSYQAHWARGLVQLKKRLEEETMAAPETCSIARVELEIPVAAPVDRVWNALTHEMGAWWRRDFFVNPEARFVLEPWVGGRAFEDLGNGAGLLWFTVVTIVPPRRLDLAGHLFPEFGGPGTSLVKITLAEDGAGTRLTLSDSVFGRVDDKTSQHLTEGWNALMGEGLKAYVESRG